MSREPQVQQQVQRPALRATDGEARERELLLALAAGIQKFAMYPRGHPMLQGVASKLHESISATVNSSGELGVGLARDTIVVGDVSIAADVPLLRDLAGRSLAHQIGAITFYSGLAVAEVERLLAALAAEPTTEPLLLAGVLAIRVRSLDYDRIKLGEESSALETESSSAIWSALAQAALVDAPPAGAEPEDIAKAINANRDHSGFMSAVAAQLVRLVRALRGDGSDEETKARVRISELIRQLDPDTLRALVRLDGDARRRAELLRAAATSVAPDALIRLITAAAEASAGSVSHSLLRVLAKLASISRTTLAEVRATSRAELRHAMDRMIEDWTLSNPNPEMYGRVLDALSFERVAVDAPVLAEPVGVERVLEISQEVGAWGPAAERVAQSLLDQGDVRQLLEIVRSAGSDNAAGRELAAVVLTPRLIYLMTASDDVDRDALREVSAAMGESAIDPLLDALADSPSRNVRRCAFDCLSQLGATATERAIQRADDSRWFVTRNMLALAATAELPESFDPMPFLENEDPRVRAAAVAVAKRASNSALALARALSDADPRVVTAALRGLDGVPAPLILPLRRVAETDAEEENRVLAVRALGESQEPAACDALIALSGAGKTWLGRIKIKRKSPSSLQALRGLSTNWQHRADAKPVLDAAVRSRDDSVRRAVEGS